MPTNALPFAWGPLSEKIYNHELTPPPKGRWTPLFKARVCCALRDQVIEWDEACRRFDLSNEELLSWYIAYRDQGISGLRVTR